MSLDGVKNSEFFVKKHGSYVVCDGGMFRFVINTKLNRFISNLNLSTPFFCPAIQRNTLVATGIVAMSGVIALVLEGRAFAKILSSIVQRIPILVIYQFSRCTFKKFSGHFYDYIMAFAPSRIKTLCGSFPPCIPIELRKLFEIFYAHNRVLSFCERDKTEISSGLDYFMSRKSIFSFHIGAL